MNFSAVAVFSKPESVDALTDQINQLPWAEVYHTDPSGKLIVMIDGENTEAEVENLKTLKTLEGVGAAEMVSHYFGEEEMSIPESEMNRVPDYLENDEIVPTANHFQRLKATGNH